MLGAPKKKSEDLKKPRSIKFSDKEWERVKELAQGNVSKFIRDRTLGGGK